MRNGQVIARRVETAFDSKSRRTGLLHHDRLAEGDALVIAPCNAIHTFFMKFSIDVAFVSRVGQILKARSHVGPWRIGGSLRAHAVIELPAGTLERTGTVAGDVLEVQVSE
jgi:uncharacterized membrane protein (UPF0127 family)